MSTFQHRGQLVGGCTAASSIIVPKMAQKWLNLWALMNLRRCGHLP
jgi:hypothetical protein